MRLVAPLLPFLLKTDDNPDGIDRRVFDGLTARIAADRPTRSTGHCSTSSAIRATLADSTAARKTGIKELDFSERPVVFLLANGRTPARVALLVAVPYPKCSKAADTVPPDWKA